MGIGGVRSACPTTIKRTCKGRVLMDMVYVFYVAVAIAIVYIIEITIASLK